MKSSSRHTAKRKRPPRSFVDERTMGNWGATEDQVCFSCLRFAGRSVSSRWHCVRLPSSYPSLQLRHGLTMAQGGTPAPITPAIMRGIITHIAIIGTRDVVALGARGRADAGRRLYRHQRKLLTEPRRRSERNPTRRPEARWRRRSFGSSSNVSLKRAVISAATRRDAAACGARGSRIWSCSIRLSRHRLGHGEFVREIRPARFRAAGRRDRGDDAWPPRRSCRHHHRHRCQGQSDHDLGQQRQPGPRSAGLARADLRLRHAGELARGGRAGSRSRPALRLSRPPRGGAARCLSGQGGACLEVRYDEG